MSQEKGDVAKKVAKKGGEPREVKSREKREDTRKRFRRYLEIWGR